MENNLLFDYGPVWMKRENKSMDYRAFPFPVAVTCGPVLTQKSVILDETSQNESKEDINGNVEARDIKTIEVLKRNCIAKRFPLNFDPCLTPFGNTSSTLALPGSHVRRFHHSSILSSYSVNDESHLIYIQSNNKTFAINVASVAEDGQNLKLENVRKIGSCHTKLSQTDSAVINGSPNVLLRVDDSLSLIALREEGFDICSVPEENVLDCCLSRDFDNHFAYINKDGTLNLFNVDKEECMWNGKFDVEVPPDEEYLSCEFGCHPSSLHVSCRSEAFLVDTRSSANGTTKRTFFDINEMKEYLFNREEIICAMKRVPNLPYIYVTCSDTLALMDIRYCKYPVLTWVHMIRGRPSYPQYFQDSGHDFHMVADPLRSQLCLVSSYSDCAEYPFVAAISTPRHLNIANDTCSFARDHKLWFTDRSERELLSPIIGLSILPMQEKHVICFQNNFGNLFYMKSFNKKLKCNNSANSHLINSLKSFEKSLLRPSGCDSETKLNPVKYAEGLKFRSCFKKIGQSIQEESSWNEFTWNLNSISNLKNFSDIYVRSETEKENKNENKKKNKKKNKPFLPYFATNDIENLSDDYIAGCSDPVSELLLSVWNENREEIISCDSKVIRNIKNMNNTYQTSVFPYFSCPYFLDIQDITLPCHDSSTTTSNDNCDDIDIADTLATKKSTNTINKNTEINDSIVADSKDDEGTKLKNNLTNKSKKRKSKKDGF